MRKRQAALAGALTLPLVVMLLCAPPFAPAPRAAAANRMLGPNFPAIIDTNGDGAPDGGDKNATPQSSGGGTGITIGSPFACTSEEAGWVYTFTNSAGGVFTGGSQTRGDGATREVHAITFNSAGRPTTFSYSGPSESGTIELIDSNGDSLDDTVRMSGTAPGTSVSMTLPLTYTDSDGDGFSDYVTLPGALSSIPGVDLTRSCTANGQLGPNPQVWVPLADSNGDGRPDAVIADFDGNGVADPNFMKGPSLGPSNSVPTMPSFGLGVLALLTFALAIWSIRRRGLAI